MSDSLYDIVKKKEFYHLIPNNESKSIPEFIETVRNLFGDELIDSIEDNANLDLENTLSSHHTLTNRPPQILSSFLSIHKLRLRGYQLFVSNYINPNTPYKKLLLKWDTGVGKTLGCLAIATNFIDIYRNYSSMNFEIGSVYVIGFTPEIFKKELLNYPEFGFISHEEKRLRDQYRKEAVNGTKKEIDKFINFTKRIRMRITSRQGYGFYKFMGYKELANKVFRADGTVDRDIIRSFENSLIICDEIHQVYNTVEKNSYGDAIQAISNLQPSARFVFTSATPLNNSPTEVVELLNLLDSNPIHTKEMYFDENNELKKKSIDKLKKAFEGKVSWISNVNKSLYPDFTIVGEKIPEVEDLKFIRCEMSDFQYKAYLHAINNETLTIDNEYVLDAALEHPNSDIGLYNSSDIRNELSTADDTYRSKYFDYIDGRITGPGLRIDKLQKYSNKYYTMMNTLLNDIKTDQGKVLIYHNNVTTTGILMIENILLANGFLTRTGTENSNTICALCGLAKKYHEVVGGSTTIVNLREKVHYVYNNNITFNLLNDKWYTGFYVYLDNVIRDFGGFDARTFSDLESKDDVFIETTLDDEIIEKLQKLGYSLVDHNDSIAVFHNGGVKLQDSEYDYETLGGDIYTDSTPTVTNEIVYVESDSDSETEPEKTKADGPEFTKRLIQSKKDKITNHVFTPARFISIHLDVDQASLQRDIELFNRPTNTNGEEILIILGSRKIQEGFDLKAIRHEYILKRPENISALVQIRGRAVRQNSHEHLPPHKRNVKMKIFVSSIPNKKELSIEEKRYADKIKDYKIIEEIESIIHESSLNNSIQIPEEEIDTRYYDIYYSDKEINMIRDIIISLFEIYPVIKKSDLIKYVTTQKLIYKEYNNALISEDNYKIALHSLMYNPSDTEKKVDLSYVRSQTNKSNQPTQSNINIVEIDDYYVAFPVVDNKPLIEIETPFREVYKSKTVMIDVNKYVNNIDPDTDYQEKKQALINTYKDSDILSLRNVICKFGKVFHIRFVEDIIQYIIGKMFNVKAKSQDPMFEFYVKMLYYYDLLGSVIYLNSVSRSDVRDSYSNYTIPIRNVEKTVQTARGIITNPKQQKNPYISELNIAISRSEGDNWVPAQFRASYKKMMSELISLNIPTYDIYVPVGHTIGENTRLYIINKSDPTKGQWIDELPIFRNYIENDIIIGFEIREKNSVHTKFKLRNPVQKIKSHTDSRLIEKGVVCSSKPKTELIKILEKLNKRLNINKPVDKKDNIGEICNEIKNRLIRLEIIEREKESNIKYFYFHYEKQPIKLE